MAPSTSDPAPRAAEPTVAVLLSWFVPGAGHAYVGKLRTGVIAFVVVELVYLLGLFFSEGRFLEYLPPEMRTRFAGMLSPEVGNLGALLVHISKYGYGTGTPSPWPSSMDLGTVLTATSGILNLFVMSSAHFAARAKAKGLLDAGSMPRPATAALMTFLIPGLGQVRQGRVRRGVLAFVMLVGMFLLASYLAEGANLDRERHFYYWSGQFMLGLPAVVVEFFHGHAMLQHEVIYNDAGVVMGTVAGLMNVLLMLDAYGYSESKWLAPVAGGKAKPTFTSPNPPPGSEAGSNGGATS